jgi:hypothetical protein
VIFRNRRIVRIRVLDPIFPGQFGTGDPEELAVRVHSIMVAAMDEMRSEPGYGR